MHSNNHECSTANRRSPVKPASLESFKMRQSERNRGAFLIRWPDKYLPDLASVHVRNQLEMSAPSEMVWAWLIRAELWPTWYLNSKRVIIDGGGPDLHSESRFRWTTFGLRLESKVEEFVTGERLAWTARAAGIDVYHAWLIEKRQSGCYVLTEETQNGWLARLNGTLRPREMSKQHQNWLESLQRKAAEGPPPAI